MSPLTEPTRLTLAKGQPVPNDPYLYTNTVLLLHGDGANGSTTIIDSSKVAGGAKTVTAVGDAKISTAIADPFGNNTRGVLAFDGTGSPVDRLRLATNLSDLAFGSENFTVEAWVYRNNTNTAVVFCGQSNLATGAGSSYVFYVSSSATSDVYVGTGVFSISSPNPSINQWAHVAWVRNGVNFTSYLNGTQVATINTLGASSLNTGSTTYPPTIGAFDNNGNPFNGYIDDLRITKGVARYTSNFTPPTAPFPDF